MNEQNQNENHRTRCAITIELTARELEAVKRFIANAPDGRKFLGQGLDYAGSPLWRDDLTMTSGVLRRVARAQQQG